MANTEPDRKEKGAEVLGESALEGIAGGCNGEGGGEGILPGLLRDPNFGPEEAAKLLEDLKKLQEGITSKLKD